MTTHLNQYSEEQRAALDAVTNLHDALREAADTRTRFRARGIEDMMDCARVFVEAMDTIRSDARLLAELGRRQTVRLNVAGPSCVPGLVPEEELIAFHHDPACLAAAGIVVLRECTANVRGWLADCNALLDAADAPRH